MNGTLPPAGRSAVMQITLWTGRIVLLGLVGLASFGLVEPEVRPTEISVAPDQVSHALLVYGIIVAALWSFPALPAWMVGLILFFAAVAAELLQGLGILPGEYQVTDIVANGIGVAAALLPVAATKWRQRVRGSKPALARRAPDSTTA